MEPPQSNPMMGSNISLPLEELTPEAKAELEELKKRAIEIKDNAKTPFELFEAIAKMKLYFHSLSMEEQINQYQNLALIYNKFFKMDVGGFEKHMAEEYNEAFEDAIEDWGEIAINQEETLNLHDQMFNKKEKIKNWADLLKKIFSDVPESMLNMFREHMKTPNFKDFLERTFGYKDVVEYIENPQAVQTSTTESNPPQPKDDMKETMKPCCEYLKNEYENGEFIKDIKTAINTFFESATIRKGNLKDQSSFSSSQGSTGLNENTLFAEYQNDKNLEKYLRGLKTYFSHMTMPDDKVTDIDEWIKKMRSDISNDYCKAVLNNLEQIKKSLTKPPK